jgi:hypothetical protein
MFRIWNRRTKQWQERDFHLIGEVMLLQGFPIKELNDLVVNEATGLKDKNGKEIYEGDRLKNGATYRLVRLVESQAAWFAGSRRLTRELAARCEVTGNDYEGATSRSRSNLRRLVMPIDLQQLNEIHRLEGEVDEARAGVKALVEGRISLIEGLPEYQALEEARAALEAAKAKFKIAVRNNREVAKLDVEIAEARFNLRDLREILSNTLVLYTQQTGKVVIKEYEWTRQIELRARISKRLLGQECLPLASPNKYLGQHFPNEGRGEGGGGGMMESNVVSLEMAKKLREMQTYYVFPMGACIRLPRECFSNRTSTAASQTNAI